MVGGGFAASSAIAQRHRRADLAAGGDGDARGLEARRAEAADRYVVAEADRLGRAAEPILAETAVAIGVMKGRKAEAPLRQVGDAQFHRAGPRRGAGDEAAGALGIAVRRAGGDADDALAALDAPNGDDEVGGQ